MIPDLASGIFVSLLLRYFGMCLLLASKLPYFQVQKSSFCIHDSPALGTRRFSKDLGFHLVKKENGKQCVGTRAACCSKDSLLLELTARRCTHSVCVSFSILFYPPIEESMWSVIIVHAFRFIQAFPLHMLGWLETWLLLFVYC
jgi:hypothetical protein